MRSWLALGVALFGCAEPDPSYGVTGGIVGSKLPNEVAVAAPGGYDATANRPATTLAASHAAKGGPAAADALACLDCHVAGGAGTPFSFGGRIAGADGKPLADVDVLVQDGARALGPVKSDADGFFWSAGTPLGAGAHASVRNATGTQQMSGALPAGGGSCDGAACHVPGKQGLIHP